MLKTPRRNHALSLADALEEAPNLVALQDRIRISQRCLAHVRPLLPASLVPHVKAGPIEDEEWCILVSSTAVSSKLRQLSPEIIRLLNHNNLPIQRIRIKVQRS